MQPKSLKINVFLNTLKTLLTLIFPLITFPYSSRILGPDNLGKVHFAQSVVSYFAILASLGISTYATREAAKVRDDKEKLSIVVKEVFLINLIATVISYCLLGISLILVPKFNDYKALIIICSSLIGFTTIGMGWLYQAVENYLYITVRSISFQIISVILLFTTVKTKDDYLMYAAVNIISNVGANILNFIHSRKYVTFRTTTKLNLLKHLKPIFILFATAITGTIYGSIDSTMLGFMSTDEQVGLYSAGIKIVHMINGLFPAIIIVTFPRISYYLANKDEEKIYSLSSKTMNFLMCFSIPVSAGLFLLMEPLVLLFCGPKFQLAITISRIMCPYLIFSAVASFFGTNILVSYGKEKVQLYTMIAGAAIDIILNSIFIRTMGAEGAAIATLITQVIISMFYIAALKDFVRHLSLIKQTGQFIFAALIMSACVYFVRNIFEVLLLKLLVPFACGVIVYCFILFVFKNKTFIDLYESIINFIKKKAGKK